MLSNEYRSSSALHVIDNFRSGYCLKYLKSYRLDYCKFVVILKVLEQMITKTTSCSCMCKLTFADYGHDDDLFDYDDVNLLISHEPGFYTKSNQFS
jgi:hypothetical protein